MSISMDVEKLADLQRAANFFNFISEPASYKAFIADAKATLERLEVVIKAHTSVMEAEKYLAAARLKTGEVNSYIDKEEKKLADANAALAKKVAADAAEFTVRQAALSAAETFLSKAQAKLKQDQTELSVAAAAIEQRDKSVSLREQALAVNEAALKDKTVKLKALMG